MHARLQGDVGVGLVELLMAIVLLGIGAVAVMAALGTATKSSALYENQTRAFTALGIAAEAVSSPDLPYDTGCAGAATASYETRVSNAVNQAFSSVVPAKRPSVEIQSITYWNGEDFAEEPCLDNLGELVPAFDRMQRITLVATVQGSSKAYTIDVVKRAA